jgi:DNA polymerase I-like protein with 3'-5' exonuclease and polymerase domains
LPDLTSAKVKYLDFETQSFCWHRGGNFSYGGDRIAGAAITVDDVPGAWYVPVRHADSLWNVPEENFRRWLKAHVETPGDWVNHNAKFDAHFAAEEGALFGGRLIDTLTLSKLIDSDRDFGKGGYGLDALSSDWLDEDIDDHDQRVQAYLKSLGKRDRKECRNYAEVPADIMGEYACQDVMTVRNLWANLQRRRDPMLERVWNTEILLTPVLFDMERAGLPVDVNELRAKEFQTRAEIAILQEMIHKDVGFAIEPWNTSDCYELLVNHFGLPVLAYTEAGNPSFDADALTSYAGHPDVVSDDRRRRVLKMMARCRDRNTLLTLFITKFQQFAVNGLMHSDYNQNVRTGRMSCKRPNAQQNSEDAKELIHPMEGCAFLSCDASQIEFRLIVHYIEDQKAIRAYAENPDTDFHTLVAGWCGIPRKPAKNVNFAMGYGGGKGKITKMLAGNMDIVGALGATADLMIAEGKVDASMRKQTFDALCQKRAEDVYDLYHRMLPTLKTTTYSAARVCKSRGFVFNSYGRIRRMPEKAAWRALNNLTQSAAADVLKERTVAIAPRYNSYVRGLGLDIRAQVHDEDLFHGPVEVTSDPTVQARIVRSLEDTAVKFLVPIRFDCKWSDKNWAIASSDGAKVKVDRALGSPVLA